MVLIYVCVVSIFCVRMIVSLPFSHIIDRWLVTSIWEYYNWVKVSSLIVTYMSEFVVNQEAFDTLCNIVFVRFPADELLKDRVIY